MLGFIYPQSEQIVAVTAIQLPFKTGNVRLFQNPIAFTPALTQAALVAIEATYTGYAMQVLTTLPNPFVDSVNGGISFMLPTQNFQVGATPTIGNDIFGGWIEDSTNALLMAWQTTTPWPMQNALQALPVEALLNFFGNNLVKVQYAGIPQ